MISYTIREASKIEHKIIYNYQLTAFEELAVNVILHKEYDTPEYVGIYIYKDRISFVKHNRPLLLFFQGNIEDRVEVAEFIRNVVVNVFENRKL